MTRRVGWALLALSLSVTALHLGLLDALPAAPLPRAAAQALGPASAADARPPVAVVSLPPAAGSTPAPGLSRPATRPDALEPLHAAPAPLRAPDPARSGATPVQPAVVRSTTPAAAAGRASPPRSVSASEPLAIATVDASPPAAGPPDIGDASAADPLPLAAAELPAAGPALPTVPVYRTRIPPAARVVYRLSRGLIVGTGELDWRPQAGGYQLRLDGKLPLLGTLITQTSRGRFDATGLAPDRHTDQRLRRSEQAANFQRPLGLVTYSGGGPALPLAPGLQDRLSVMLQLAAIAAAGPQPPPPGQTLSIGVTGVRGDGAVWELRFEGVQSIETPDGPVSAWRYLRQPDSPHDTVAEFWLDPARQFLPVRVKLTEGNGDALELRRQSQSP